MPCQSLVLKLKVDDSKQMVQQDYLGNILSTGSWSHLRCFNQYSQGIHSTYASQELSGECDLQLGSGLPWVSDAITTT